jgi:hypothetical protein
MTASVNQTAHKCPSQRTGVEPYTESRVASHLRKCADSRSGLHAYRSLAFPGDVSRWTLPLFSLCNLSGCLSGLVSQFGVKSCGSRS